MKFKLKKIGLCMVVISVLSIACFSCFDKKTEGEIKEFVAAEESEAYRVFLSANTAYISPKDNFTVTSNAYVEETDNEDIDILDFTGNYSWSRNGHAYTLDKLVVNDVVDSYIETWTEESGSNFYHYIYTHGDQLNGIEDKYERKIVKHDYAFYSMVNDEQSKIIQFDDLGNSAVDFVASIFDVEESSEQTFFTLAGVKVIDFYEYDFVTSFYKSGDEYRFVIDMNVPNKKMTIEIGDTSYNCESQYDFSFQIDYTEKAITNIKISSYQLFNYDDGIEFDTHKIKNEFEYTYEEKFVNGNMRNDLYKYVDSSDDTYVNATIHYHLDNGRNIYETKSIQTNSFGAKEVSTPENTSLYKWYLDKNHTVELRGNLIGIPSSHLDLYGKTIADEGYAIVILEREVRDNKGKLILKDRDYEVRYANFSYNIPQDINGNMVSKISINNIEYLEEQIILKSQGYYHIKVFSRID